MNPVFVTFSAVSPDVSSCLCCVKMMVKTACDRELVSFMFVAATVLERNRRVIDRIELFSLAFMLKYHGDVIVALY